MKRLRETAKADGVGISETEGGSHTKVQFSDGRRTVVPRHNEINENTANSILKQMGVK
nr:type II toxin-antitoxin system HicA family toxin [Gordonia araii]